jgi:uncharacterized protein
LEKIEIEYDEAKRLKILEERGLDMARSAEVFAGEIVQMLDDRNDYQEVRFRVWGFLDGKRISLVWTPRGSRHRIITIRHAHELEHKARLQTLD